MPMLATRVENFRGKLALVPAYRQGYEVLEKVKTQFLVQSTVVKYSRKKQRSDWYWGLLHHVADGCGVSRYLIHADLKLKAELVEEFYLLGANGPIPVLKSTKETEMDDVEHKEYCLLALELLFRHWLPGVRRPDVLRIIDERYGGRPHGL